MLVEGKRARGSVPPVEDSSTFKGLGARRSALVRWLVSRKCPRTFPEASGYRANRCCGPVFARTNRHVPIAGRPPTQGATNRHERAVD